MQSLDHIDESVQANQNLSMVSEFLDTEELNTQKIIKAKEQEDDAREQKEEVSAFLKSVKEEKKKEEVKSFLKDVKAEVKESEKVAATKKVSEALEEIER